MITDQVDGKTTMILLIIVQLYKTTAPRKNLSSVLFLRRVRSRHTQFVRTRANGKICHHKSPVSSISKVCTSTVYITYILPRTLHWSINFRVLFLYFKHYLVITPRRRSYSWLFVHTITTIYNGRDSGTYVVRANS